MRHIDREPEPDILQKKHSEWLVKYNNKLAMDKSARPDSSKYGHIKILEGLNISSSYKCFYCETKLKNTPKEVDHFIEVAVNPQLAFTWNNLYLACDNCNNKIPDDRISVLSVLNPCIDSDEEIRNHITFFNDEIHPLTEKGQLSIKKYKLDTQYLDTKRIKHLQKINEKYQELRSKMDREGRLKPTKIEVNSILSFANSMNEFSLMSEIYINTRFSDFINSCE